MKTRFNSYDIVCVIIELQKYVGLRVHNIYDIDNKTYLIKLQKQDEKCVLLIESGNRIHVTGFEWPKNMAPSGFSMKLRKHLKNKRLESLIQLGTDRIIDLKFGSGEAEYHVIVELYDRGNIILTDYEFTILNLLRPHTEADTVKFVVREKYPRNRAKETGVITKEALQKMLESFSNGEQLKKMLVLNLKYGPAVVEHVLLKQGFTNNTKIGKNFDISNDIDKVMAAIIEAEELFQNAKLNHSKGYIIQKKEERFSTTDNSDNSNFYSNQEFHPYLFQQYSSSYYKEFESFNLAVDEFFSSLESQKLELKALQQEREAVKKLENVRKDHDQRLIALEKTQELDKQKAELITRNQVLVDNAIIAIQTALANQMSWTDIQELVKDAVAREDEVAKHIKQLKLETNHISLFLTDPYAEYTSSDNSDQEENDDRIPSMIVDIDLGLTAFANGRKYYDLKRTAAKKQQKTIESQSIAFKSAEKKTKQTLKDVQTITNINKARKVYWFEKFFWFISSENYLVIGGRDQQQNEMIVKRYMKPNDAYVHADVHGASSIIIKNPSNQPIPPKTLNEAGTMAICYSVTWDAKVVTNAYWVWGEQVSKTAPTGEYLSTGSFMIRGKKNFLPVSHLVLGLSFLFRLEDGSVERHRDERKVITGNENEENINMENEENKDEVEVEIPDESDAEEEGDHPENLDKIKNNEEKTVELNDDKNNNSSCDTDEENSKFPDTHVKIQRFSGTKINLITNQNIITNEKVNNEKVVYLGDDKPIILKSAKRVKEENIDYKSKQIKNVETKNKDAKEDKNKPQTKRGQKSKLKKIKEKYKDQDEEERKLRMEILQSAGSPKVSKKNKKSKDNPMKTKRNESKTPKVNIQKTQEIDNENTVGGDEDEATIQTELDMIDYLTGIPVIEDELLFAIPVIAPYNTLNNYKFKVKITPGTSKRGKAARTALSIFLKDRTTTQREKDLLKAVKDEQLARNIPGKVKLSAPRLQAIKK